MRRAWWYAAAFLLAGQAAAQDMPLTQVLLPGEGWQAVEGDWQSVGGLAADREGNVYIVDPNGKQVRRLPAGGGKAETAYKGEVGRGLGIGPGGVPFLYQPDEKRLVALGPEKKVLAEVPPVQDVAVTREGNCYVTVPSEKAVYLIRFDGTKQRVDAGIAAPSGIALWNDQGTLVVGDADGKRLYAFRIERDGSLTAKEGYYTLRVRPGQASGVAGLTTDSDRRLYAATREGVQVFDPTGRLCGVLLTPLPEAVTAVALGGAAGDRLYIACGGKLFVRKTKARAFRGPDPPRR